MTLHEIFVGEELEMEQFDLERIADLLGIRCLGAGRCTFRTCCSTQDSLNRCFGISNERSRLFDAHC